MPLLVGILDGIGADGSLPIPDLVADSRRTKAPVKGGPSCPAKRLPRRGDLDGRQADADESGSAIAARLQKPTPERDPRTPAPALSRAVGDQLGAARQAVDLPVGELVLAAVQSAAVAGPGVKPGAGAISVTSGK